jgi:hypothetical protein
MEKTGTLKITNGESRVDGTLLARNVASGQDPFGAATDFVKDNGCDDGDCVTVTGTLQGKILYIDSAKKVSDDRCAPAQADALRLAVAAPTPAGRAITKKKSANKATLKKKSAEPKKAPKKSAAKKKPLQAGPANKASAKSPVKKKAKRR